MRVKAGNKLSNDAQVVDFGSAADLAEVDGHVAVSGLGSGSGAVSSVFSRTGAVTAAVGDYSSFYANTKSAPAHFYPEDYGAAGDGVTDDTAAIQAAIDAAGTAAGGIVQFQAKTYLVATAPRTDRGGNAQLAFPVYTAQNGPTIELRGAYRYENYDPLHAKAATILKSTSTATYDGTNGQPSVIGGPTSGNFNLVEAVIHGICVQLPANPNISGIDLKYVGRMHLDGVIVITADGAAPAATAPTHPRQFGVRTPTGSNYNLAYIGTLGVYGCYTGVVYNAEHVNADYVSVKWCLVGIGIDDGGTHGAYIQLLSTEWCAYHIAGVATTGVNAITNNAAYLNIGIWNIEDAGGATWYSTTSNLYDTSNNLRGTAPFNRFVNGSGQTFSLTVSGGGKYKLIDLYLQPGYNTIAFPASGVAFGLIYRDAVYYLSGGTVSAVSVDGHSTGLTSGAFLVPSGKAISVNYTVQPTNLLLLL